MNILTTGSSMNIVCCSTLGRWPVHDELKIIQKFLSLNQ